MASSPKRTPKPAEARLELPGEVLVFGSRWTIEFDDELHANHETWAVTQPRERRILVDPTADLPTVILHELWHVICENLRPDVNDEDAVGQAIGVGYRTILSTNPDFRDWLIQEVS